MKKILAVGAVVATALLTGCASSHPQGFLLTDVTLPTDVTSNTASGNKVGSATCQSILSLVATGDCSLNAAMKNGGITQVTHVDWKAHNILGIIGNYTITVYGK